MNTVSIFQGHSLTPVHQHPVFRNGQDYIWPSVFLLLVFSGIVLARVSLRERLDKIMLSSISLQTTRQIEREDFNPFKPVSLLLSFIFCFLFGFFVYQTNKNFGNVFNDRPPAFQFLAFCFLFLMVFAVKYVFHYLIGLLTGTSTLFNEYTYSNLLINQATGIVLFPFLVATEFSSINPIYLLIPCLFILGFNLALKWFRGFVFSAVEQHIGFLQIFIYFCAVEILPSLVLVKFIIVNF